VLEWVSDWYRQNLCDFCNPGIEVNLPLVRTIAGQEQPPREDEELERAAGGGPGAQLRQAPPRDNPAGPSTGSFKVLRGGSWRETQADELTATRRYWLAPTERFANTGFRCARDESRQRGSAEP
jgi:formylglycine-generating enzyme required for sulfatase activity